MERKGRSKPNVAGERYDSNAIPVESKDYATGIKKDKKIVSKKSKKAKKSSKKKKSKSSVDDYIGLFVFGFLLAIVMAAVSMHMFPYVVKEIRRGLGKLLRNKTVAVIHPVLFGVHKVFHEMFGTKLVITTSHVMHLAPLMVMISIYNGLRRSSKQ